MVIEKDFSRSVMWSSPFGILASTVAFIVASFYVLFVIEVLGLFDWSFL